MEADNPEKSPPTGVAPGGNSKRRSRPTWIILTVIAIVIILMIISRDRKHHADSNAESTAPVVVAVARVVRTNLHNEVIIPGEFRPYLEVELHAKVSGYVDKINVDFGDKVKSGQLLATLEVPELRDQLHNAVALQQRAEMDYTNEHLMYDRLREVNQRHSDLVAQQDLDTAQSKEGGAIAAVSAAKAEVERYQTMVKYTQITAPFDGVITRRYADPGSLIQAGTASDTQSMPLVRISDNYHLRLDFPVSVEYVKDIKLGDTVQVRVDSLGGKTFAGVITRSTSKVNEDTRTMMTEVELANPSLQVVPGMYAVVVLDVERHSGALAVPIQAVTGGTSPTVYVVNGKQEIESRNVVLGMETPDAYEIVSGVVEGDLVVIGNRTQARPGQKVETKLIGGIPTP